MKDRSERYTRKDADKTGREREFLRALNAAAASLQQTNHSEAGIYQIFRELLLSLAYYGTLALLDESQERLILRAVVYSPKLLTLLEKATKLKAEGTSYPLKSVDVSREVITSRQPVYLPDTTRTISQIAPAAVRSVVKTVVQLAGPHSGIYAPLVVNDQVFGLLNMSSKDLTAADIPAVMAFAYHISVALQNARLVQEMGEIDARYRRLFETAGDAILLLDSATTRILSANNQATCLLGHAEDELLAMSLTALHPPELAGEIRRFLPTTPDQDPRVAEYPLLCQDGRRLTVRITASCFDSGGQHLVQYVIRDVTERKRAESLQAATYQIATVANSAVNLQELYQSIHGIIGELMDVSNFYIAIYHKEADMVSMPYFVDEMEPAPAPYKAGKGLTEHVIRTGKSLLITGEAHETLIERAEAEMIGQPAPIWLGVPLESQGGTFGAIVVQHYRDAQAYTVREKQLLEFVSGQIAASIKRKQSENALRQSEERFRRVFEEGPLGMTIVDLEGRFKEVNVTLCHMTGYSEVELSSLTIFDMLPGEERELVRRDIDHLISENVPRLRAERRIARKDNGHRWANVCASAVKGENGRPLYLLITVEDITERKEAENALRHAQKMKSLGILAGGVAHDFNNLLVGMLGQSSLALSKLSHDHPARTHVGKTVKAAELAAELTRQLLAYSGRGQFVMQPLDLNEIIGQNLHLLEASIPKNISLQLDLSERLPLIEADAGQIQQVVMNLILNAAEAIGERGGTVKVATVVRYIDDNNARHWERVGQPLAPDNYVLLGISDDGPGMDADILSKIFDPFFTTKQSGRGLGLAAVLGIVRGHKAGLRVSSEVGQGTVFELLFRQCHQEVERVETMLLTSQKVATQRAKVLIIDDESLVREAVTDILEMEEIEVISAANGVAGIDLYLEHLADIDLVLLDLSMPGINGEETLVKLQQINPAVQVVLSSGFSKAEMSRRFEGKGLVGFVPKPYDADYLVEVICHHLQSRTNGANKG